VLNASAGAGLRAALFAFLEDAHERDVL